MWEGPPGLMLTDTACLPRSPAQPVRPPSCLVTAHFGGHRQPQALRRVSGGLQEEAAGAGGGSGAAQFRGVPEGHRAGPAAPRQLAHGSRSGALLELPAHAEAAAGGSWFYRPFGKGWPPDLMVCDPGPVTSWFLSLFRSRSHSSLSERGAPGGDGAWQEGLGCSPHSCS